MLTTSEASSHTCKLSVERYFVLGWVTVSGFNSQCGTSQYWYVTSHPGQPSLAIPSWVGAVSTSRGRSRLRQ